MQNQANDPDFVQSLARGLLVIRSFGETQPRQSLSDVARSTGLTRATARRLLLTLHELGYVRKDDRYFSLAPSVLELGYAYLSALGARAVAQPYLESLAEELTETSSMTVLDGTDIVYVARAATKRLFSLALSTGSRLPAYVTSMGRILLAELPEEDVDRILSESNLEALTPHTIVDPQGIKAELEKAKVQGWYILDQELELGVRAIAVPIRDSAGQVIASMNVSTIVARTTYEQIQETILPALLETADGLSRALQHR